MNPYSILGIQRMKNRARRQRKFNPHGNSPEMIFQDFHKPIEQIEY